MRTIKASAVVGSAVLLLSAGALLTTASTSAEAGMCRKEYCAKRLPVYSKCANFLCTSRIIRRGQCVLTGVRLAPC